MVPDLNQLPWLLHRRWAKSRRVHKTENCRVHANAQTKRKRDHQGKDWRLAQHAQGIADILKKNGHGLTLSVTQSAPLDQGSLTSFGERSILKAEVEAECRLLKKRKVSPE
jgi:hypothetical protein